jgi:hypothetical protein
MKTTWCTLHSIYWESRASTCFEHYLLILRRRFTNGTWYMRAYNVSWLCHESSFTAIVAHATCFGLSSTSQQQAKLQYQRKTCHVNYIKTIYEYISVNTAEISTSLFAYEKMNSLNIWTDSGFTYSNKKIGLKLIFSMLQQPLVGQCLLIINASLSNSDSPHSVGLLCRNDQPYAENSTWQHSKLTRDKHSCPRRDSKAQSQEASCHRPTP